MIEQNLASGGNDWPDIPGFAEALTASAPTPPPPAATPAAAANAAAPGASANTPEQTSSIPTALPGAAAAQPAADAQLPYAAIGVANEPGAEDLGSKLLRSPVANGLAILLLFGMLAVLVLALSRLIRAWPGALALLAQIELAGWRGWAMAALCLAGLGVSFYMAFVETTHVEAICGPVGDCNAVQQSAYARYLVGFPSACLESSATQPRW